MDRARAWVLNLAVEEDLLRASSGGATPSRAVQAHLRARVALLRATGLLGPEDVVLDPPEGPPLARLEPFEGRAWSPTPAALRTMARAGVRVCAAPSIATLRAVCDRAFVAQRPALNALGVLDGAGLFVDAPSLDAALGGLECERTVVLKRRFSFAGRGRLVATVGALRRELEQRWITASMRLGGVLLEPWLARSDDFALHGFLSHDGALTLGEPTAQRISPEGAWMHSRRCDAGELSHDERRALDECARVCAGALRDAGYFGPFGVDAFRYVDGGGVTRFRPLCELNARYTMGWAVGMGDRRPDR